MLPSAVVVNGGIAAMRVVPRSLARAAASLIGTIAWLVDGGRRRTVLLNLEFLAPQLTGRERRRLARTTFQNLYRSAVDLFRLPSQPPEEVLRLVQVLGREHLDQAIAEGHGVIVATPHLGPYELGAAVLAILGYRVHGVAEDLDPETNAALAKYREATGMRLISRSHGSRALYRVLKDGDVALLVADRVIARGAGGAASEAGVLDVRFGAGMRPVPTGPAAFAAARGAPVVTGFIVAGGKQAGGYTLQIEPPINPGPERTRESTENLTLAIAGRLAAAVSRHPDQWFVFQPDWRVIDSNSRGGRDGNRH
ncbi:MAG: lysophospholipid acyltransferase family protein [Gemmatimonadota bacterium]